MAKNISGHFVEHLSSWRRMAAVAWSAPDDPTIYGTIDLDMTDALEFLREESERTGEHLTVTHLVTKAMADTLAEHPECNCIIRRGRIFERDDIDISVLVAVPPEEADREQEADLSGALVKNADRRSIAEIASEIREGARKVRKHEDPLLDRTKKLFDRVPPAVMGPLLRLVARLQYDFNLDLSAAGIPNDPFGSAIVTSVGVLGITEAFPPLLTATDFHARARGVGGGCGGGQARRPRWRARRRARHAYRRDFRSPGHRRLPRGKARQDLQVDHPRSGGPLRHLRSLPLMRLF